MKEIVKQNKLNKDVTQQKMLNENDPNSNNKIA